jgi:hypothetical protein
VETNEIMVDDVCTFDCDTATHNKPVKLSICFLKIDQHGIKKIGAIESTEEINRGE